MKTVFLLAGLLTCTAIISVPAQDRKDWIPLFNGNDLEGWHPKIKGYPLDKNYGNTFRVEDGLLKVAYDRYEDFDSRFGHIFYETPFSYYRLKLEYRFTGDQAPNGPGWAFRNSGIMIHCQAPETMAESQDFPISIEVQLLGGDGSNERPTANVCTPGTHIVMDGDLEEQHCIQSGSETYHGNRWVEIEVVVYGDSLIQHYVEGNKVLEYSNPQIGGGVVNDYLEWAKKDGMALTEGYISLQSESHPVDFRNVELLNLMGCTDPAARNYKEYYIKSDNSLCEY